MIEIVIKITHNSHPGDLNQVAKIMYKFLNPLPTIITHYITDLKIKNYYKFTNWKKN